MKRETNESGGMKYSQEKREGEEEDEDEGDEEEWETRQMHPQRCRVGAALQKLITDGR